MRSLAAILLLACGACDDETPAGSGDPCGGIVGQPCSEDEFCEYTEPGCGIADGAGTCQARPTVCPEIYAPVMGSDGRVYSNACEAHANGVDDCGPAEGR